MQALPATTRSTVRRLRKRVERLKDGVHARRAPPSSLILTITSHVVVPQASGGCCLGCR